MDSKIQNPYYGDPRKVPLILGNPYMDRYGDPLGSGLSSRFSGLRGSEINSAAQADYSTFTGFWNNIFHVYVSLGQI